MQEGKVIIFSAPSGSGKTTVVKHLLASNPKLAFSVSATTRQKRPSETEGKDYYFISNEEFLQRVRNNEFVEYEEVYAGTYYGTLRSEVERIWSEGRTVIFDVDVVGGLHIKRIMGAQSLSIYVRPPSIEVLQERLKTRATETSQDVEKRVNKALYELQFESQFDKVIVNDHLDETLATAEQILDDFLKQS